MKRTTQNLIIDVIATIDSIGLVATGLLIYWVLPAGIGKNCYTVWGMDRHEWGDVHFWMSVVIIILVLIHLILHWNWVCAMIAKGFTGQGKISAIKSNLIGVVSIILCVGLLGGFLLLANANVVIDPTKIKGQGRSHNQMPMNLPSSISGKPATDHPEVMAIRGLMTFNEVAKLMNIPVDQLIQKTGLPDSVTAMDQVGKTIRQYQMEMDDFRYALTQLQAR